MLLQRHVDIASCGKFNKVLVEDSAWQHWSFDKCDAAVSKGCCRLGGWSANGDAQTGTLAKSQASMRKSARAASQGGTAAVVERHYTDLASARMAERLAKLPARKW